MATTTKVGSRRVNCPILTHMVRQQRGMVTPPAFSRCSLQWMLHKLSSEYQLEGKSGASSRGNSSFSSVY